MKVANIALRQFPLPTKKRLQGTGFKPHDFLDDWITNDKKTTDGKMVNPNAISFNDYIN
ncbi:hypothetical protein [Microscilla marina]|nr:hypothetical protein [Microscilla marina]